MAFTGGLVLKRGDGAATEAFVLIPEVFSMSGLGAANPTIDVTSFDSTAKEFIAGLPEGQEVTIECNRVLSNTVQEGLITDVQSKLNRNFTLDMGDGSVTEVFSFTLTMQSWAVNPANEDKHTLSITGKISGAITRATS
ncbi:MAG: hypothetical protein GY941_11415 [Planctomycetes bacterium]|nr:hypothetical protein [Planctomycetota bacterium]